MGKGQDFESYAAALKLGAALVDNGGGGAGGTEAAEQAPEGREPDEENDPTRKRKKKKKKAGGLTGSDVLGERGILGGAGKNGGSSVGDTMEIGKIVSKFI